MKITQNTISVLKNFSQINSNVVLRPGKNQATISTGKHIYTEAQIEEDIPVEVPIYDLTSLLAVFSLADDPDVEFGENSMVIRTNSGGEFEYFYSDPEILVAPPQKTITIDEFFNFSLSKEDITTIVKSAAVMSAPVLSFVSKKGKVFITVSDPKNNTSNSYRKQIGEFDEEFNVMLGIENLKVIPDNYNCSISKKKFLHLHNADLSRKYWIACSPQSVI